MLLMFQPTQLLADNVTLQFSLYYAGKPFSIQSFQADLKQFIHDHQPELRDVALMELGLYITGRLLNSRHCQTWIGGKGRHYQSFNFLQSFNRSTRAETLRTSKTGTKKKQVAIYCRHRLQRHILKHMVRSCGYIPVACANGSISLRTEQSFAALIYCTPEPGIPAVREKIGQLPFPTLLITSNVCLPTHASDVAIPWPVTTAQLSSELARVLGE